MFETFFKIKWKFPDIYKYRISVYLFYESCLTLFGRQEAMDHLYIILEHSRFDLIYTDLHFKSFGEKYIVYFLVSQVMSLKQCQHNDHVLANIKKICCVLFFKVKTWIFYVHVIYMNLCCFYFIHCICLVTSQMFAPAAHSCMLHRFKSLELCILNGDFEKKITLTFFLVSGHYWVIVFICLENWRG